MEKFKPGYRSAKRLGRFVAKKFSGFYMNPTIMQRAQSQLINVSRSYNDTTGIATFSYGDSYTSNAQLTGCIGYLWKLRTTKEFLLPDEITASVTATGTYPNMTGIAGSSWLMERVGDSEGYEAEFITIFVPPVISADLPYEKTYIVNGNIPISSHSTSLVCNLTQQQFDNLSVQCQLLYSLDKQDAEDLKLHINGRALQVSTDLLDMRIIDEVI